MDIQLTDVSLDAVEAGKGNVYHFTVDGTEITVERWGTENSSGQEAYLTGLDHAAGRVAINPSDMFGQGTNEEIDRLIDAFDAALDLTAVRQAEQFAVESAIAELPPREPPQPDDLTHTLARHLWAKYGEERIADWDDLSPENRESWLRDARDVLSDWEGDDYIVVREGTVTNGPRLPVLDLDLLEQDAEADADVVRLRVRALALGVSDVAAECAVWLRGHGIHVADDDV